MNLFTISRDDHLLVCCSSSLSFCATHLVMTHTRHQPAPFPITHLLSHPPDCTLACGVVVACEILCTRMVGHITCVLLTTTHGHPTDSNPCVHAHWPRAMPQKSLCGSIHHVVSRVTIFGMTFLFGGFRLHVSGWPHQDIVWFHSGGH